MRDLLVLDDVPALVLLGQLQVEVQLVPLLGGGGKAEPQQPHPGQRQAGQQEGGLSQGLADCPQRQLELTTNFIRLLTLQCTLHTKHNLHLIKTNFV